MSLFCYSYFKYVCMSGFFLLYLFKLVYFIVLYVLFLLSLANNDYLIITYSAFIWCLWWETNAQKCEAEKIFLLRSHTQVKKHNITVWLLVSKNSLINYFNICWIYVHIYIHISNCICIPMKTFITNIIISGELF